MKRKSFNLKLAKSYTPPAPGSKGKKRIKDRGIRWEPTYGEKSDDLKKRFDETIGPGSYERWEGHDYTTDSDYFVVVGPALTKQGQKRFFAGIKKLPPKWKRSKIYAPSGEYFHNLFAALSHATEKWNTPFTKGQRNYTIDDLANVKIPRHVKA